LWQLACTNNKIDELHVNPKAVWKRNFTRVESLEGRVKTLTDGLQALQRKLSTREYNKVEKSGK